MPLFLHLSIHLSLAILSGYILGRRYNQVYLGVFAGLLAGFFIDLDHVLEYFLVFGPSFNLRYFLEGRQFLLSDQIRLYFHAWEYFPLLLLGVWFLRHRPKLKFFLLTLAVAGLVHLFSDVLINNYKIKNYSLIYRASQGYSAEKLLSPEAYQLNRVYKYNLGI